MTGLEEPQYMRVRNWEKFQHYKDRRPAWIKNYVDVDDPSHPFSRLSYADQGRLQKVWRWAAKVDNLIPYDLVAISRYLGGKPDAIQRTISGYMAGEWLQVGSRSDCKRWEKSEKTAANRRRAASTAQQLRKRSATPETETETETKTYRPVGNTRLTSEQAASDLFDAIRPEHRDTGTRAVVMAYAAELDPSDFASVLRELRRKQGSGEMRNDGRYVNRALSKRATKKANPRVAAKEAA